MVSHGSRCVSRLDEAARGIYNRPDRISGLEPQTAKGAGLLKFGIQELWQVIEPIASDRSSTRRGW
jgi:hypothetical protein